MQQPSIKENAIAYPRLLKKYNIMKKDANIDERKLLPKLRIIFESP
jgi:uncharacterized protein YijF (DUF1287 family)